MSRALLKKVARRAVKLPKNKGFGQRSPNRQTRENSALADGKFPFDRLGSSPKMASFLGFRC